MKRQCPACLSKLGRPFNLISIRYTKPVGNVYVGQGNR